MLDVEQVSVINDLKGTKECRNKGQLSGERNNKSKDNISVVKTPSSLSLVKTNLKLCFGCFAEFKSQQPDQLESKG